MSLEEICAVIDFDGFRIGKKFYCREFGYATLRGDWYGSYLFKLDQLVKIIKPEDRPTIWHNEYLDHGLPFKASKGEETEDLRNLEAVVKDVYVSSMKKGEKIYVAYKGGHVEKDLLEKLDIPCLNLEHFGCPKYDHLPYEPDAKSCGHHTKNDKLHCPRKEVYSFRQWILRQLDDH